LANRFEYELFYCEGVEMSKVRGQLSFFVIEEQLDKIYKNNGFLPKLNTLVDWELFRGDLSRISTTKSASRTRAPRVSTWF
jgi:hypothetical protein